MTFLPWRWLFFFWYFRQKRFSHALAELGGRQPRTAVELWALYRLGMFFSVAETEHPVRGARAEFARVAAYAARGDGVAAQLQLGCFEKKRRRTRTYFALAAELAPYLPGEALKLIDGHSDVPTPFQIALLLKLGLVERARRLLDAPSVGGSRAAELHLLRTNAFGGAPHEKLARLNAFLSASGVSGLRLVNPLLSPAPINVATAEAPSPVAGPLVSILMTTFNTSGRAVVAVESLLAQSYRNLNVVVVDDASSDDTLAQLQGLCSRDARVRVIALPRNVGTYAAKLIGLETVKGEFVMCHDSDDWSHPARLARQVAPLLSNVTLIGTVSNWLRMQDDGLFHARLVYPLTRLNPSSLLFRRERVVREAGAWDCVRTGADSEFLARLRVIFGAKAIKKIAEPLALGSHRHGSLMTGESTGYSAAGMSPQRLAYWEAWSRWHIDMLARGERPFIPADVRAAVVDRRFEVPPELKVSVDDVEVCWRSVFGADASD